MRGQQNKVSVWVFEVQCGTLTCARVGGQGPGKGADLPGVLGPPQALQLGKFTASADERAQALKREQRSDARIGPAP